MNKKIPLMLDSSVFKQVPKLNSMLFKELIKHTRVDIYELYISEIIENEFLTWIRVEAKAAFDTVVKATNSLNKYSKDTEIFGLTLGFNATAFAAQGQINRIFKDSVGNWEEFKKVTNATILPIEESHGKIVMDWYFNGDPPFEKVKNRLDIPDAFILCSLKELLKTHEKVFFISSDKSFLEKIESEDVVCFGNLSDLFSSEASKLDEKYFNSLDDGDKVFTLLKLYEEDIHKKIKYEIEVSDLVSDIEYNLIESVIGDYSNISTSTDSLSIDISDSKNITSLSFLISFSATLSHSVSSKVAKEELFSINDERLKRIEKEVQENGDYEINEVHRSLVQGHFSIEFEDSNPSTWKAKKREHSFLEPELEEITISIEDIELNA